MTSARIYDISQTISATTPVWPGEPSPSLQRTATISDNCPVNVSVVTMSTHTGAHADAPFHYAANGAFSADCDVEPYLGPCVVVDARDCGGAVDADCVPLVELRGEARIIFRTYARFPAADWDENFCAIDAGLIDELGSHGTRLIGSDAPSLDPQSSKTMDAHRAILRHDMRILEGLDLDGIGAGRYELIALPLKLANADASPVRAVLREIP